MAGNKKFGFGLIGLLVTLALIFAVLWFSWQALTRSLNTLPNDIGGNANGGSNQSGVSGGTQANGVPAINAAREAVRLIEDRSKIIPN